MTPDNQRPEHRARSSRAESQSVLTRDDLISGLRDLVSQLSESNQPATIQIVGGAAISLMVNSERLATVDIDALISPPEAVTRIAQTISAERGWPSDWLNDNASIFIPTGVGRSPEWETIYAADNVTIQVASARMLLAMKLNALMKRPARDAEDVAVLLRLTDTRTADAAEELLSDFFPGDGLPPRTYDLVVQLLAATALPVSPPERPHLEP